MWCSYEVADLQKKERNVSSEESGLQEARLARGSSRSHLGTAEHTGTPNQTIFSKYIIHLLKAHTTFYSSSAHRILD